VKPFYKVYCDDCLHRLRRLEADSVDLVFTSPPYGQQRKYAEIKFSLAGQDWVDWMIPRVVEMCRVCRGLVFVNAVGPRVNHQYQPIIEWLVADLTRHHAIACGPQPYVFAKNGMAGSGGEQYHRRDWEPVYAFVDPAKLPILWSDNTATGHPPKHPASKTLSSRKSGSDDRYQVRNYQHPEVANSGNIVRCTVGKGHMGSDLAHQNEAPFPESLAKFFVLSYCPPDGTVLDPFCGSGTTLKVALLHGRNAIGIDARKSQVELTELRIEEVPGFGSQQVMF